MIVYIAGPMTGIDHYNFPAFHAAARALEQRGYVVKNPAAKETKKGTDLPDKDKLPREWGGTRDDVTPGDIRRYDFRMIDDSDAVVLMPGWESSNGALMEAMYAQTTGKSVYILQRDYSLVLLHKSWVFKTVIEWHEPGYKDVGNTGARQAKI